MSGLLQGRAEAKPIVYAYTLDHPSYRGALKIGYTEKDVVARVEQQVANITLPVKLHQIVFQRDAVRVDGSCFTDKTLHRALEARGFPCLGGEWYRCTVQDVERAYVSVKHRLEGESEARLDFKMRPEQERAVTKTALYYRKEAQENPGHPPKMLWNAKMRFGKTFATYQLAKMMGFKRVLILTFKPAVQSAWEEDLKNHIDFRGWQFIVRPKDGAGESIDAQYQRADKARPIVCFGSFQDFLGRDSSGNLKAKNQWVHEITWDLVAFDEYHFGAWRENAKQLFDLEDEEEELVVSEKYERGNAYDEGFLPISTRHYLFLSGTPFRALNTGEFIEEQIFCWTYRDEQSAKAMWQGDGNPYAALPQMVMLTYQLPEAIRRIAQGGEYNEFDLNVFFSASGTGKNARFIYEREVQGWLDFIRGKYLAVAAEELKTHKSPPQPYGDNRLRNALQHTLWYLPNVASCHAMANLLQEKANLFYQNYQVIVCAGSQVGNGVKALEPVKQAMGNPFETQTITLTCGKLTTGVTVKPWGGILMLRNLQSPETYFQAAFRVQSPWEIAGEDGSRTIVKPVCYVFDFAPNRALRQVAEYGQRLSISETTPQTPEQKLGEFIHFLPILYYNGTDMRHIDAGEILDIATAGTSATLLARRWESALLVNVDNDTLRRLMNNDAAMEAIKRIEGFRNLNVGDVMETIINKSEEVKKAKREGGEKTPKEKKVLTEEEKEYKSKRKQIQEKLIKFATRIPIFMYLTDDREHTLKEVIAQVETALFERVTGLSLRDFELLISLGLFNDTLMNDAVLKFKRYEDASLSYAGIDKHAGDKRVGGWDTSIRKQELFLCESDEDAYHTA